MGQHAHVESAYGEDPLFGGPVPTSTQLEAKQLPVPWTIQERIARVQMIKRCVRRTRFVGCLALASMLGETAALASQLASGQATDASLTVDSVAQEAYLKASNPDALDNFGFSVAASGDTVVAGAIRESSHARGVNGNQNSNSVPEAGAAYVFVREGTAWSQQAYLKASNTALPDHFGESVAVSGDTIVVGAPLERGGSTGVNGDQNADANTVEAGAAYVFVRDGTTWSQQAYLKASNTDSNDDFGTSVAVSGDTIVVGAFRESSGATGVNGDQGDNSVGTSGAAYVFVRDGTAWSQEAYLKASNTGPGDFFGISVAVSGDTIVVGAQNEDSDATGVDGNQADNSVADSGAAYVFVRNGTSWRQEAYLKASNTDVGDLFGSAVAVSGDTAIVGAKAEDSNAVGVDGDQSANTMSSAGAAYVFVRRGSSWSQEAYLKASNTGTSDAFGSAVTVSGETLVVGAWSEDSGATGVDGSQSDNSVQNSGAAYVFRRSGSTWNQDAYLKASSTGSDRFGFSLATSGSTMIVGAPFERSNAAGVDGDQSNNSLPGAGAAYVFDLGDAPLGSRYCTPAVPNSTGQSGVMTVIGSSLVRQDDLGLVATELPTDSNIGYFIMGTGMNTFTPPGSSGPICVAPGLKRFLPRVNNTNELPGGFTRDVGTSGLISGSIAPGSTWNFQAWHRDQVVGTSNLTDAISVTFQ